MRRPQALLCSLAVAATLIACLPVVFLGKSLLAPENGAVPLFYDQCPRLPGYTDCSFERVHGADVGSMMWAFFPLTAAQERSIKQFGEFPLWNRYNSAGTTLLGQGQMMLGDPLQWLTWLVGAEAWTFDVKFVLLRAVFAASLGIAVFTVTRAFVPAALVAVAAPFIGYFGFRLNHPAIFTLCYSPLILLAWLKLIYGEERRRLAWVCGLMAANWLVLNSGTAKEAYMALVVLNAMGAAHAMLERSRFGGRFGAYAGLLAASGVCFLLVALPVWGSLLDAIQHGTSRYQRNLLALQYHPGLLIGFVDNLYFVWSLGVYFPAVNALLFAGLVGGVLCSLRKGEARSRTTAIVLSIAGLVLVALAWGGVPSPWLLQVPFVRNILHVHTTFSTILIVPACVLAGIGFAHFAEARDLATRRHNVVLVVFVAIALFAAYVDEAWPTYLVDALLYSVVVLGGAAMIPELAFRQARRTLSRRGTAFSVALAALLVGHGAMYPPGVLDWAVLNPAERVSLAVRPALVDRVAHAQGAGPLRAVGVKEVLMPGYNATVGLETVSGPDAIWNVRYRELIEALELPFSRYEDWRLRFFEYHFAMHARALDFLGVGLVLSSHPVADPGLQRLADDGRVTAYSRASTWPRAFFVDRVETREGAEALAERVRNGDGRPFVAFERASIEADDALRRLLEKPGAGPPAVVAARDYVLTNNATSFTIDAPRAGVVYLAETDEPGDFRVTVNGVRAKYWTANHAFKATVVDAPGTYRVTFRYWPRRLSLYLALSCAGLACWLLVIWAFAIRSGTAAPAQ